MKLRPNRKVERQAVNAARSFFESNLCVFQEVDVANDYGKDAYVDFSEEGRVTGLCAALQIKGGASYRDARGDYRIPLDEEHAKIWSESTVPIFGIVHDPDDGGLRWCNISTFLQGINRPLPANIPLNSTDVLTPDSLRKEFKVSLQETHFYLRSHPVLQAQSADEDLSNAAIIDCFGVGRSDPRVLITLRYLVRALAPQSRRLAIHVLSHVTPHPDIFWHAGNWIMEDVKNVVRPHLRWSPDEIRSLLEVVTSEEFERGGLGESLYMLFYEDPNIVKAMRTAAIDALELNEDDIAVAALYLVLYWEGEKAHNVLQDFLNEFPEANRLPLIPELQVSLREHEFITLF